MSKKLASLLLVICMLFCLSACGNYKDFFVNMNGNQHQSQEQNTNNKYLIGTDFGGDIALVGKKYDSIYRAHSNIVINKEGKELFELPNGMIAAHGRQGEELSPSNNYIFATKLDSTHLSVKQDLSCKYVLDKEGKIILSPEKNGYDKIVSNITNFNKLANDGYLVAFKEESSYTGTEQYYWIIDFDGNIIGKKIPMSSQSVHVISNTTSQWTYIGDGLIDVGWFIDIKNGGKIVRDCPRDVDYIFPVTSWANDENGNKLFKLEAHAEIFEFYKNKAGVVYDLNALYNKNEIYVGLIDKSGRNILQPFQINFEPEEVFVYTDGFLVAAAGNYQFYDFSGKNIKAADTVSAGNGDHVIYNYNSGFFRVCYRTLVGNVSDYQYRYVNYLKADGTWLFK